MWRKKRYERTNESVPESERQASADESKLGFGHIFTDHMLMINYTDGKGWHDARIGLLRQPFAGPCQVLHYGQEIFEGLLCYRTQGASTSSAPRQF